MGEPQHQTQVLAERRAQSGNKDGVDTPEQASLTAREKKDGL